MPEVLGPIEDTTMPLLLPLIDVPTGEDPDVVIEEERVEFYIILFLCMIFFFVTASLNEKYKPRCGHQTSYTIIFGLCISLILYAILGNSRQDLYKFS